MAGARADPEAYVRDTITANANMMVPHYLIHSFLYYEQDRTLISDDLFDRICRRLRVELDALTHPHKHLVDPECLRAGTGFYLSGRYPALVIGSANALYNQFHPPRKKTRK